MRNIQFFKDIAILPHSHPDIKFADCIPLTFKCQKRQDKHDTVAQETTGDSAICPVRFGAYLVRQITSYPGTSSNTNVSAYMSNGSVEHVTSRQVINALHNAVCAIGKEHLGISKKKSAPTPSDWDIHVPGQMPCEHNYAHWPMVKQPLPSVYQKTSHGVQPQRIQENAHPPELPPHTKL
jgi:hypothetical protein